MAVTYEAIATQTTSGSATSVTFSSVPSTYTDIVIEIAASLSADNPVSLQLNSDAGANYSATQAYASTGGGASYRESNQSTLNVLYLQTTPSSNILHLQNYSNTSTYKTILMRGNSIDLLRMGAFLWRSTAAISTIKLTAGGGSFTNGSIITLYGIKAA